MVDEGFWTIRLFDGPIAEQEDGAEPRRVAQFGGAKPANLLVYLALQFDRERPQYVSRDQVVERFWPVDPRERTLEKAYDSLDQALSTLRKILLPKETARGGVLLRSAKTGVALNKDRVEVDVNEFEICLRKAARAPRPDKKEPLLLEALTWTGSGALLPHLGSGEDPGREHRIKLAYADTLMQLADIAVRDDKLDQAVDYAQKGVKAAPLPDEQAVRIAEQALCLLIHVAVRQGRPNVAARRFNELLEEYRAAEISFSQPTLSLVQDLREGKSLDWPYGTERATVSVSMPPPSPPPAAASTPPSKPTTAPSPLSIDARVRAAAAMRDSGRPRDAAAQLQLLISTAALDTPSVIEALLTLSSALRDLGDMEQALFQAEEAARRALGANLPYWIAKARARLALVYHQTGQPSKASELVEIVLPDAQKQKWADIQVSALSVQAYLLENSGQCEAARVHLGTALAISKKADLVPGQITVLSDIARIYGIEGKYVEAIRALEKSSALATDAKLTRYVLENEHREALFCFKIADSKRGRRLLQKVQREAHAQGMRRLETEVTHSLGKRAMDDKNLSQAVAHLTEALGMAQEYQLNRTARFIRLDLAFTLLVMGRLEDARAIYRDLWRSLQPLNQSAMEILVQFLPQVINLVPAAEQAPVARLIERARALQQPVNMFSATRQIELQRLLAELPPAISAILE